MTNMSVDELNAQLPRCSFEPYTRTAAIRVRCQVRHQRFTSPHSTESTDSTDSTAPTPMPVTALPIPNISALSNHTPAPMPRSSRYQ